MIDKLSYRVFSSDFNSNTTKDYEVWNTVNCIIFCFESYFHSARDLVKMVNLTRNVIMYFYENIIDFFWLYDFYLTMLSHDLLHSHGRLFYLLEEKRKFIFPKLKSSNLISVFYFQSFFRCLPKTHEINI